MLPLPGPWKTNNVQPGPKPYPHFFPNWSKLENVGSGYKPFQTNFRPFDFKTCKTKLFYVWGQIFQPVPKHMPTSTNQCQPVPNHTSTSTGWYWLGVWFGTGWGVVWYWLRCGLEAGVWFGTKPHLNQYWLRCGLVLVGTGWGVVWKLVGVWFGSWGVVWSQPVPNHTPTSTKPHPNQYQTTPQPVQKQRKGKT